MSIIPVEKSVSYRDFSRDISLKGWRAPDTYSRAFACEGKFPAVYLFLLVDQSDYIIATPAYVGMSLNLAQRWSGHPVLKEISRSGLWVQRWFKKTDPCDLRRVERKLIERLDPAWNIACRPRGFAVR